MINRFILDRLYFFIPPKDMNNLSQKYVHFNFIYNLKIHINVFIKQCGRWYRKLNLNAFYLFEIENPSTEDETAFSTLIYTIYFHQ